jgi:hypothetical protein
MDRSNSTVLVLGILILGSFTIGFSFDDAFAQKPEMITFCHSEGGSNPVTLTLPAVAANLHLNDSNHDDYLGECVPEPPVCEADIDCNDGDMCTVNVCDPNNANADSFGCVVTPVNPDDGNVV